MNSGRDESSGSVDWGRPNGVIIVPLDGSNEAKAALPVARLLSASTGASVHIIHASDEALSREALLRRLKLSRRDETIGVVIDRVSGEPATAIVRSAEDEQAVAVVMSNHGETTYLAGALGPVLEQVLQDLTCPAIIVRPELAGRIAGLKAIRRILLPLDGSATTMSVIEPAVSLARMASAEITVVFVAEAQARVAEEPGTLSTPRYVDQPQYEWPAWVQECVDRLCACLGECAGNPPVRVFVRHGEPRQEILGMAREQETDLIVLEWRGRLDPTHAETVRGVLAEAPCPAMLLRASG